MAKQNAMLAKIEAKYATVYAIKLAEAQERYLRQLGIALQQSSDAAMMAIDDVFDVNTYSAEKFHVAHVKYVNDMASLLLEDYESDPTMEYTKTDIDRRLMQIVGEENFVPWDERYGGKDG